MNVFFDHQIFTIQRFGGISRYFVEIMKRMPEDINVSSHVVFSDNFFLKKASRETGEKHFNSISLPKFKKKERLYMKINDWKNIRELRRGKFDLFHPTYFDPYFLRELKRPYVVTVHDMIYEKFPELFGKDDPTIAQKKETITNADKIIAISDCTKRDVMDIYGIPEERIKVIYHGHNIRPQSAEIIPGLPRHYILYVGQRFHYKNFNRFLQAFALLHMAYPEISLVCTGKSFSKSEAETIGKLGLSGAVTSRFVSDNQLATLYRNAICFVFPSLYEGFGIPILEAYASQCPVALSDASCFPEIAGDAAGYFDPYDIDSIKTTIEEIICNSTLRSALIKKGTERLKRFSWEKTAQETADLYRQTV